VTATSPTLQPGSRVQALDALRGLVIVLMALYRLAPTARRLPPSAYRLPPSA
jgi:uncharacterized membrane protein